MAAVAADLPYIDCSVETWRAPSGRAALAWIAHAPERVGGIEYVRAEPRRVALFSGRPAGDLDPRGWWEHADRLDGRFTGARYDDDAGELELLSDALGAYPLFTARDGDRVAFSNSAEVLRRLLGTTTVDPASVASLVAGGWSLSGHPMWADVRRVPRGVVLRLAADGAESLTELLPASTLAEWFAASAFDAERASFDLVESVRALAGWPGRPDQVPVTGGRDSRLILAAALRAGIDFQAVTNGAEGDPDVVVAQQLCARAGVAHERFGDPAGGSSDHRSGAERAAIVTGGTAAAEAPWGIPSRPEPGPLVLWHSGQGGEIARGIYGRPQRPGRSAIVDHLYRTFVARRPGRPELLSPVGEELVRGQLGSWTAEMLEAGIADADVPDAFYLLQRMSHWAAPGHAVVEWVRDTTSPLWSTRVIPHMLAMPTEQRARELFHLEVLRVLAPELVPVPFADGQGWPADESRWARRRRRAAHLAARGVAEARRHVGWMRERRRRGDEPAPSSLSEPPPVAHPLTPLMTDLRSWMDTGHPALAVVDRDRVQRLLELPPATLDFVRHAQVMRLATVLMGVELAG